MRYLSLPFLKEKLEHTGFKKYLESTSWALSSKVLSMAISLLATIFIARKLGPTNYGELSYAISFIAIFSFLASLGIDNIVYRDLIKYREKTSELLGTALTIKLISGIGTSILCFIFAFFFAKDDVSKILIVILSGTFIFSSFQIVNHEFQAQVASKYPAIISFIVAITINLLKIFVILTGKGVIYLSLVLLFESLLFALLYLFIYKKVLSGKVSTWRFNGTLARSLLKDSWPLIFSSAFALIYSRIDQVFIKHMIDARSVGIYDSAVRVAEVWYFIPYIIVTALFPAIVNAKKNSEQLYNARLAKFGIFLFFFAVGISIPITILAPFIITVLYGEAFLDGVIILQIYTWASIGIFIGALLSSYLVAENQRRILFFTSLLPMISNVSLNLIWIPTYGIVGAAYATVISYSLIPVSIIFFKDTRVRIRALYHSLRT